MMYRVKISFARSCLRGGPWTRRGRAIWSARIGAVEQAVDRADAGRADQTLAFEARVREAARISLEGAGAPK